MFVSVGQAADVRTGQRHAACVQPWQPADRGPVARRAAGALRSEGPRGHSVPTRVHHLGQLHQ